MLYTNYFDFEFSFFIHFTNQITLKPSVAQKFKLVFKFSTIMEQIFQFGPIWGIKDEEMMEKHL